MKEKKKFAETQETILIAARQIFAKKGLAGARMQEIADSAGINKALLHYYYRNKETLFEQVFHEALQKIFRPLGSFLSDDSELFQKIRNICRLYNEFLIEYPFIPNFVMNEINSDPSRILNLLDLEGVSEGRKKTLQQVDEAIKLGKIRSIDPEELILNIISLSIFPFLSRPVFAEFLYKDENMDEVLKLRADRVSDFIIQSIKI